MLTVINVWASTVTISLDLSQQKCFICLLSPKLLDILVLVVLEDENRVNYTVALFDTTFRICYSSCREQEKYVHCKHEACDIATQECSARKKMFCIYICLSQTTQSWLVKAWVVCSCRVVCPVRCRKCLHS